MAMRIEFDTYDALRPSDRAHVLDDVAFNIVVAMRNHGPVKSQ